MREDQKGLELLESLADDHDLHGKLLWSCESD